MSLGLTNAVAYDAATITDAALDLSTHDRVDDHPPALDAALLGSGLIPRQTVEL